MMRHALCWLARYIGSIASPRAMHSRFWNEVDSRASVAEHYCDDDES